MTEEPVTESYSMEDEDQNVVQDENQPKEVEETKQTEQSFFNGNDLVIAQTSDGEMRGGGYKIKSKFLEGGQSIMTTIGNALTGGGGKVSCSFENFVVPAGLFYVPKNNINEDDENEETKEEEAEEEDAEDFNDNQDVLHVEISDEDENEDEDEYVENRYYKYRPNQSIPDELFDKLYALANPETSGPIPISKPKPKPKPKPKKKSTRRKPKKQIPRKKTKRRRRQ
jgi:hypothetical protein